MSRTCMHAQQHGPGQQTDNSITLAVRLTSYEMERRNTEKSWSQLKHYSIALHAVQPSFGIITLGNESTQRIWPPKYVQKSVLEITQNGLKKKN